MSERPVELRSQRVLEQLLDAGTWELDLSTMAIGWSERARDLLEFGSPVPATFAALLDRIHPEDVARVKAAYEEALTHGALFDVAHRLLFPDGRTKRVRFAGSPVDALAGRAARYCGVLHEIVERSSAGKGSGPDIEQLRSEELLKQAVRVSGIGIFDHDQVTDTTYWSTRLREMHGWDADEPLTTEKCAGAVHPDDAGRIANSVQRAHSPNGTGGWEAEYRIIHRDGSIRWLVARSQTFFEGVGPGRRPVRTVGAILDLTERKLAEEAMRVMQEQLYQAQKMESVGRLAGGIAHDFNNLLTVMRGYLDLAVRDLDPIDPLRLDLEEVRMAVSSAASLTQQLLSFSRRQVITPQLLCLNEGIERVRKMLGRILGEDIELRVDRADGLWPVRFDAGQLEQILFNLAANARDAMPNGGRLVVETKNVRLDVHHARARPGCCPGDYVLLNVSDDGSGMSKDVQGHIFEPFYTTKGPGLGTGLGLATVYGAVQQNDGRIEVQSEVGHGTSFKIYLPRACGEAPRLVADGIVGAPQTGHETILLVEDEATVRSLAAKLLSEWGFRVHAFADGPSAIGFASTTLETVHLLVTDVVMPGMNGRELAERLRAIRPEIRVLFTSGYTANILVPHGIIEDGIDFLPKPYAMDALGTRIREILDRPGRDPAVTVAAKAVSHALE
jgi:PAS domain S-box-containing protein